MPLTVPNRNEVPVAYTWDAASVFASDAAWEAAVTVLLTQTAQLERFHGRLHESPAQLAEYLMAAEAMLQQMGLIQTYMTLRYAVDMTDQTGAGM
ncbi:oligoendopeptidase F family protein, partial [Candidatus Gracilibacteria bacterium]|nr:oligoendopeptidase F family protein [Candidatus Gracilibacteria bacterium]